MKRDYIPGLGDTVDLVLLGASWDAKRARELNGPPKPIVWRRIAC
jgi:DNA ligase-4